MLIKTAWGETIFDQEKCWQFHIDQPNTLFIYLIHDLIMIKHYKVHTLIYLILYMRKMNK